SFVSTTDCGSADCLRLFYVQLHAGKWFYHLPQHALSFFPWAAGVYGLWFFDQWSFQKPNGYSYLRQPVYVSAILFVRNIFSEDCTAFCHAADPAVFAADRFK